MMCTCLHWMQMLKFVYRMAACFIESKRMIPFFLSLGWTNIITVNKEQDWEDSECLETGSRAVYSQYAA